MDDEGEEIPKVAKILVRSPVPCKEIKGVSDHVDLTKGLGGCPLAGVGFVNSSMTTTTPLVLGILNLHSYQTISLVPPKPIITIPSPESVYTHWAKGCWELPFF